MGLFVKNRLSYAIELFLARLRDAAGSDAALLNRFIRNRDEDAFEALVGRNAKLVIGICRRILGNEQDAEDAFQATFLVLAQKAATLKKRGRLANWLFGVAHRTALEAKRARA